jgi:D-alanine-D-alanine ligase
VKNLFILSGGVGREREVSLSSGKNVMELLDTAEIRYEAIVVNQDKSWKYKDVTLLKKEGADLLNKENALVFQTIHGTYGEDGELTSLLEENNILFVGSSSEAMRLTIDKYKTEQRLKENGIATTESVLVESLSGIDNVQVVFPAFVKPKDEGSSIALFKVKDAGELRDVLNKSIPLYGAMLVQPFIAGREFTCGVVEMEGKTAALLPTEVILTKGETFDYEAKYSVGGSKEVTPAEVDAETTKRIQDLVLQVHSVCGCKDISRTDMIMKDSGELVVLEINTIPGMTKTSFIPAQLEASGYSVTDFMRGMLKKYSN